MATADRVRRLVLAAAAVAACAVTAPLARASDRVPLDGVYIAKGTDGAGGEYEAAVHIMSHGDGVLVTWLFARQEGDAIVLVPFAMAVGIVTDAMLAVSYYGASMSGVALYRIEEGGQRLVGRWTAAGSDGTEYAETLTRLTTASPEPVEPAVPRPEPARPVKRGRATNARVASPFDRQEQQS